MTTDRRTRPHCNIECDKKCAEHTLIQQHMAGKLRLVMWLCGLIVTIILGEGYSNQKTLSAHDEKDEKFYSQTNMNTQFLEEQKILNRSVVDAMARIDKSLIRMEEKLDHHLKEK